MTVFLTAILVLGIIAGGTLLCVGTMMLAERLWRRSAGADLVRGVEALLRAHAA